MLLVDVRRKERKNEVRRKNGMERKNAEKREKNKGDVIKKSY
jgi:hypothetical protein